MGKQGLVPGVQVFELTPKDLQDPQLALLNQIFRQISYSLNLLSGSQGKLQINVTLDMQGNEIDNAVLDEPTVAGITLSAPAPTTGQSDVALGNGTATTATAGSGTLPANPAGFLVINVGGQPKKVPFYDP